ncbi:radical SAM/SPASM domain-containing protein [Vulcanisaeta thermophila]|uniref:radical SAM/SPASM domain-containing protein n=1 Tax=Vulcanisaeta thermophila TaxID=867917 RepID=UPI000853AC62|nr:radical SAM protein [Vulcanisaeta thermophila]
MIDDAEVFLEECPASPLGHILALRSHTDGTDTDITHLNADSPNDVSIYITHSCNLRCAHCYLSAGKPLKRELTVNEWLIVLDKLRELGVRIIYIIGGEPSLLIKRGLLTIIRYARELGFYVSMSTNGTLINRDAAMKLREAGLSQVQVSIDGPNPAVNDAIRGVGSFNAAIKAIGFLKEAGIAVSLSYTVMSSNAYYVSDMVRLAERLGIPVITFIKVQGFGRASENRLGLSDEEARYVVNELMRIKTNVKIILNGFRWYLDDVIRGYQRAKDRLRKLGIIEYSTCPAGRSRFVIDSNGDVYGCELLMHREFYEGNALSDDLRSIWRNGFKAFRDRKYINIAPCNKCPLADLCNSSCPARAFAAGGSVNLRDPQCNITLPH